MEEKKLNINYKVSNSLADFDTNHQELIAQTIDFAKNAYAPYSNFKVSAALILQSGKILKGANVENASYPVGICAERTLVSHAVSNYPNDLIKTIAIYVDKELPSAVPPCGLCRQTLVEVEKRQKSPITILLVAKNGTFIQFSSCSDLLPFAFDGDYL